MTDPWLANQLLTLAPDDGMLRSSRLLTRPARWQTLGCDERAVWGELSLKSRAGTRTRIDLDARIFDCTCRAAKFPCTHCFALLILLVEQPEAFTRAAAPPWVAAWPAEPAHSATTTARPPLSPARAQQRHAAVVAGLDDLRLWLHDLVRHGLATLPQRPPTYWSAMADRLVDAQAPALARALRRVAALPGKGPDWPEQVLGQLGRIYLLVQGFGRFDALDPATRADLRSAVGWLPRATPHDDALADDWLIIGRTAEDAAPRTLQRLWLWGTRHNRPALILHVAHGRRRLDTTLVPGTIGHATARYYAGQWPLQAYLEDPPTLRPAPAFVPGYPDIAAGVADYAQALARNPWLNPFPMALTRITVEAAHDRWFAVDPHGYRLPLAPRVAHAWHLRALTGPDRLALFGEWDGAHFTPLTVWHDGALRSLHQLRGVP